MYTTKLRVHHTIGPPVPKIPTTTPRHKRGQSHCHLPSSRRKPPLALSTASLHRADTPPQAKSHQGYRIRTPDLIVKTNHVTTSPTHHLHPKYECPHVRSRGTRHSPLKHCSRWICLRRRCINGSKFVQASGDVQVFQSIKDATNALIIRQLNSRIDAPSFDGIF